MDSDARRLATELHDGPMQELTLARLQIDLLRARSAEDPALAGDLEAIGDLLQSASDGMQRAVGALSRGVREPR